MTVNGLAALAAIPVVVFMLWGDYYDRYLQRVKQEKPDFDRPTELFRVRMAGLYAILSQLTLLMGTGEVRREHPIGANLILVASILVTSRIQASLERKIRGTVANPTQELKAATRAFAWTAIFAVGYMLTVLVTVSAFALAARALDLSKPAAGLLVLIGGVVALGAGLLLGFALQPVHTRRTLKTAPLTDADLLGLVQKHFRKAGLRPPSAWIIAPTPIDAATAFMAGFRSGRGWFRPGLFVSQAIVDYLSQPEIEAILLHEVSHLALNHLRKRVLLAAALIGGTTIAGIGILVLVHTVNPASGLETVLGPIAGFFSFFAAYTTLGRQSRFQELEADIHSISRLGGNLDTLARALRKLDSLNDQSRTQKNPISLLSGARHPATELRIKLLEAHFGPAPKSASVDDSKSDDQAA